jgi:hypothetical protein
MQSEENWVRIPLIGNVKGIVLVLPPEPISEENWQHLMACLDAMKPGLTYTPPRTEETTDAA